MVNAAEYKKSYEEEVDRIRDLIVKNFTPEKIILFGSGARGQVTGDSDIDMLIVKDTKTSRRDNIRKILKLVDNRIAFEPLVYTPSEIRERPGKGDFFLRAVLREGRVIYGA